MQQSPRTQEAERSSPSGYLWVAIGLALVAAGVFLVVRPIGLPLLALGIALIVLGAFTLAGLYMLQPNEAAILLLFGAYVGTDRPKRPALGQPVLKKQQDLAARAQLRRASSSRSTTSAATRSRSPPRRLARATTPPRRCSTSRTTRSYVRIQSESAVRHLASSYVLRRRRGRAGEITLRGGVDEVARR